VSAALIACMVISNGASAQRTLYLDSISNVCVGKTISIALRSKNFDSVLGIQATIVWDSTYLKYTSYKLGTTPVALTKNDVNLSKYGKDTFTIAWSDAALNPETISDTSAIITLNFTVVKTLIGSTPVSIINTKASKYSIIASDANGLPFADATATFSSGYVSFINQPTISKNGSTLTDLASGSPSGYQWNLNGSPISGATSATLTNATVAGGSYTVTANYVNGCSLTSTPLLPLSFKGFNGYYKAGSSYLTWNTTSELNVAYYAIQRSTNGRDFVTINKVAANNVYLAKYAYNDAINASGKVYYRIMIVEKNDAVTYSKTVAIMLNSALSLVSIYPNPVTNGNLSLQLQNSKSEVVSLQVVDMLGKVVKNQQAQLTAGINTISLDLAAIAKGSYVLLVKGETTQQQQFIKY